MIKFPKFWSTAWKTAWASALYDSEVLETILIFIKLLICWYILYFKIKIFDIRKILTGKNYEEVHAKFLGCEVSCRR